MGRPSRNPQVTAKKEAEIKWTKEFIQLVEKYPILYDTSLKDYRNNQLKDATWAVIVETLNDGTTGKKI